MRTIDLFFNKRCEKPKGEGSRPHKDHLRWLAFMSLCDGRIVEILEMCELVKAIDALLTAVTSSILVPDNDIEAHLSGSRLAARFAV